MNPTTQPTPTGGSDNTAAQISMGTAAYPSRPFGYRGKHRAPQTVVNLILVRIGGAK